mgnify:CR=1 FL=1|jgi:spore coat polysaccharide biosynthesis protein SpsF (cytidylyltransferase family)
MKKFVLQQSIAIIIYVRLNSKRLPEKALLKVNSMPLLSLIVDRIKKNSKFKFPIIIATSTNNSDNKLAKYCKKNKLTIFRGALSNVFKRTRDCIKKFEIKYFVRVCADRPFFDVFLMDKMIIKILNSKYDIITNQFPRSYPKGLGCEVSKANIFNEKINKKLKKSDKEHIFNYFYRNYKRYEIFNYKLKKNNKKITSSDFSINNKKDLIKTRKLYKLNKNLKYIDVLKI